MLEQTGSLRDDQKNHGCFLHCSRQTLSKYREYLLATLQYTEIFPYIDSSVKRLIKSPKGYLINNGLISYLTGIHDLPILKTTGLIGHRFENWFLNEMQTWLDVQPSRHQITFWRTSTGAEIDFSITLGSYVLPFEITYANPVPGKKIKNLINFMKHEPKCTLGVICYPGPLTYDEENRLLFLPASIVRLRPTLAGKIDRKAD